MKKRRGGGLHTTDNDEQSVGVGVFHDPADLDLTVDDFEDSLLIDEHELNDAIQRQPDLFFRISKILALQISRRDAAKSYLANVEAQIDAGLRRNNRTGKDRLTDKAIEAQKRVAAPVVKAMDQLLRMDHSVRLWTALKEAVIQRGHALRELVNLYVNNYYMTGGHEGTAKMREVDAGEARRAMAAAREPLGNRHKRRSK